MITLGDYLLVSGILFSIGFAGVMLRRNLFIILMSLELMFNAANLSLVAFSRFRLDPNGLPNYNAQVFVFFIITVAAAEVAVGLAILVALFRARQMTNETQMTKRESRCCCSVRCPQRTFKMRGSYALRTAHHV